MRKALAAMILCGLCYAWALSDVPGPVYTFTAKRQMTTSGSTQIMTSGNAEIRAYAYGADSTVQQKDCVYLGGPTYIWAFLPDSSYTYSFYEIGGIDTLITSMEKQYVTGPDVIRPSSAEFTEWVLMNSGADSAATCAYVRAAASGVADTCVSITGVDTLAVDSLSVRVADIDSLSLWDPLLTSRSNGEEGQIVYNNGAGYGPGWQALGDVMATVDSTGYGNGVITRFSLRASSTGNAAQCVKKLLMNTGTGVYAMGWTFPDSTSFATGSLAWGDIKIRGAGMADRSVLQCGQTSPYDPIWTPNLYMLGYISTDGALTAGDARSDSISLNGTVKASPTSTLCLKNPGGTGSTTVLPPRVTGDHTANLPVWGIAITNGGRSADQGHNVRGVYVAGMTSSGMCMATVKHRWTTDWERATAVCECVTDSVIVTVDSEAAADTVFYQFTR